MAKHEADEKGLDTAPDLVEALHLGNEEALTGPSGGDPLDAGYVPADRPYGVDDPTVTAAGMREGESLDDRLEREEPEDATHDTTRTGRLVPRDAGPDGRATDEDPATVAEDVGVDGAAASAEEAAVHELDQDMEPVLDESPADDPEVARQLSEDQRPGEAEEDAVSDFAEETEPQERPGAASRIDANPDTGGVPGVDGARDAGISPRSSG
ncbi:hypothetical protein GCM10023215_41530 [Pseudonocardia yuanmonensis]|uniref:DUF5709 domain-containing protein n=1 Tax=Pseudonocardia yuanmonensis TaxID=1095914 RepID=A0ABP8X3Z9_9PSEU